jgi:hypothetical protein
MFKYFPPCNFLLRCQHHSINGPHESVYLSSRTLRIADPVAERSRARVCGRWLAGTLGSNPAWMSVSCVMYFKVAVSAMDRSLVQTIHTDIVVCVCDLETFRCWAVEPEKKETLWASKKCLEICK